MRKVVTAALALSLLGLAGAPGRAAEDPGCEWLAGDLHIHTVYSHDAYGGPSDSNTGPDEAYTLGWTVLEESAIAASRGLDYISITDHNNIDAQADPGWGSNGLIWVPAYENSLAGHVQMLGATRMYDNGAKTLEDVHRVAGELRADGGAFQVNHPDDRDFLNAYGGPDVFEPDALEVWNIGVWAYHPPFPATNDHEFPLRLYDAYLDAGQHVAATGGSDSHWRSTTAVQGVGQPTTWVCASEPTVAGIIDGIHAARTTISHQPPAYEGPFALIRGDRDGDGEFESIVGDHVEPGSALRVEVDRAPGAILRVLSDNSRILAEVPVDSEGFTYELRAPQDATWVRAEVYYPDGIAARGSLGPICVFAPAYCENRLAVVAVTSPIFFRAPVQLTLDAPPVARPGETIPVTVSLAGRQGPVAGAEVLLSFRDQTYRLTTDARGEATTSLKLAVPPGSYPVTATFAGSDRLLAASAISVVDVSPGPPRG